MNLLGLVSNKAFFHLVPGKHPEAKSQAGVIPCVPGHPHAPGQHCGQGSALGATELLGGKVSD